jgi:hypothetical protein
MFWSHLSRVWTFGCFGIVAGAPLIRFVPHRLLPKEKRYRSSPISPQGEVMVLRNFVASPEGMIYRSSTTSWAGAGQACATVERK